MKGIINRIISDGYERCINITCDMFSSKQGWFYFVDETQYLEEEQEGTRFLVGQKIDFGVSMIFVNEYELLNSSDEIGVRQLIEKSSHSEIKAVVIEIIDDWTLNCNIGLQENVVVEFESKIEGIEIGQKIFIKGNLKIELEE